MIAFMHAALLASASCPASAAHPRPTVQEYRMDVGHSFAEFSIGFAFSRIRGRFTQGKGTILYDSIAPERSSITVVFESKSIDTGWGHRDQHLRTSDFFDVEKYPTVEFRSTRLLQRPGQWIAEGDLTMHGVTKRITIPFRITQPPTRSAAQSRYMVLNAAGAVRISRVDFGILGGSTYNSWFDKARAATMADSVDIELEVEGYRPDARSQLSPRIEALLERARTEGVQTLVAMVDSARKAQPSQPNAFLTGGDYLVRGLIANCRMKDAIALSTALVRMYPEAHSARLVHGLTIAISGDRDGAERQYAEAKKIFRPPVRGPNEQVPPDDPAWWYLDQLAQTALEWGYAKEAVPFARALAEIYPETSRALTTYGVALATVGDRQGAAAQYDRAIALDRAEARAIEWRRRLSG